jgi:transcription initiation factor TFIIIB Brf1 subunit/transcription initiation factor TFIIB
MGDTVSFKHFTHKKQCARSSWVEITVVLHASTWGIKAGESVGADGKKFFIYPIRVTDVMKEGEGARNGIAVGDIVVEMNSVKVTAIEDLIDLPSMVHKGVSVPIQRMLNTGGTCHMKLMRNNGDMRCTNCSCSDIIEVAERGDLVCQTCAVVVRSSVAFVGMNWENDSTTYVESEDGAEESDTCHQHIDTICAKMDLDTSVSNHAKRELILFHKANNAAGGKIRYKPVEALAAACILIVCRFQKNGRTEREVLAVCSCTKKHLAIVLRGVNRAIVEVSKRSVIPVSTTKDVIQRFCANINVSPFVVSTASYIVQEIDKRGICQSRLISSIAGASIFLACVVCHNEKEIDSVALLRDVSAACGAADATIREVCKALHVYGDRILPRQLMGSDLQLLLLM